ncbi:hypothetical protein HDV05_008242 [Chytridiales sp. JEL 0842]|nr:hypothetical protein HDV05_008242 [Chytridiales sp. JEL 0842]
MSSSSFATSTTADSSTRNMQQIQHQVDEVVGIMQGNIQNAITRGETIHSLSQKTDDLQTASVNFKKSATGVKRGMWWKDVKMGVVVVGVVLVLVGVVGAVSVAMTQTPAAVAGAGAGAGAGGNQKDSLMPK